MLWKVTKVLTAFGLIVSTVIVSIAGMIALIAAFVALSRGNDGRNGGHHRHVVSRQLRNLFLTVRQLLWCYAMFGADDGNDPFFREAAYDTSLVLSICCGNPSSFWFWMRAHQLRRRRHRYARGWGRRMSSNDSNMESDLEGAEVFNIAAKDTLMIQPTSELIEKVMPETKLSPEVSGRINFFAPQKSLKLFKVS